MAEATADSIQGQIAVLDSQQGRFSFGEIHEYFVKRVYPEGFSKENKQALRKRSKFFAVRQENLYYVGGNLVLSTDFAVIVLSLHIIIFYHHASVTSAHAGKGDDNCLVMEEMTKRCRIISHTHDSSHLGVNRTVDVERE